MHFQKIFFFYCSVLQLSEYLYQRKIAEISQITENIFSLRFRLELIIPSSVKIANAAVTSANTGSFVSISSNTKVIASIQSFSIII